MSKDGPNHEHKFVIPVEWEDTERKESVGGRDYLHNIYKGSKVTKLRCECGEEIGR